MARGKRVVIGWVLNKAERQLKSPRSTLHSKMEKLNYFDSQNKYE